ncbi:Glucosyl-3-phosphoglycerate/mannosyl-3-phosphoglycerate phosphatase [subsurface metagenome]
MDERALYHRQSSVKPPVASRVIFTDLDGSLLDHDTYSYEVALPLVKRLDRADIPLVFCSSKTRAEQEVYRRKLKVTSPFIVENGGAIFIGRGYFPFPFECQRVANGYQVIELARPYSEIRRILEEIRLKNGLDFRGYGDMAAAEIAHLTGLDLASARLAQKREYQETLNLTGSEEQIQFVLTKIKEAGLNVSRGGRFYGVMAGSDKGRAVTILTELFQRKLGPIETIGIGDSLNDVPMLARVGIPVLVKKPGNYWEEIELPGLYRIDSVGPQGWVKAVAELTGI